MWFHKNLAVPTILQYIIVGTFGFFLFSAFYWLAGRMFESRTLSESKQDKIPTQNQNSAETKLKTETPVFRQSDEYFVSFGNNIHKVLEGSPGNLIAYNGEVLLKVFLEKGRILVSAKLFTGIGAQPVEVEKNNFVVTPPYDRNFNETAFEVVNRDEIPIFQIIYTDSHNVSIYGGFGTYDRMVVWTSPQGLWYDPKVPIDPSDPQYKLKRIFKYPSRKYLGQEIDDQQASEQGKHGLILRPEIYQSAIGLTPERRITVTVFLGVSNIGDVASIADDWRLSVILPTGREVPVPLFPISDKLVLERADGKPRILSAHDAIYKKTIEAPILAGAKVQGFLVGIVPDTDIKQQEIFMRGTVIKVACRDVLRHEYTATYTFSGEKGSPNYIPGLDK